MAKAKNKSTDGVLPRRNDGATKTDNEPIKAGDKVKQGVVMNGIGKGETVELVIPKPLEHPDPNVHVSRVDVPLHNLQGFDGYQTRGINITNLTRQQRSGLAKLFRGLHTNSQPRQMKNGRYVNSVADAIRWMLEQVDDAHKTPNQFCAQENTQESCG